ncbi:MAG: ferritin [Geobacteraceae bacterium GWC2_58_44]|nr:MAG: ferritin [Geobacteraceae bacterium GWC2_58_44]
MNVFDFAMKIELQGKAYYENLAASAKLAGLRTIFTELAADEQKHYDVLRGLKEGKTWEMADSRVLEHTRSVFTDLLRDRDVEVGLQEALDAYKLALKVEADSVRLYEDMAKKEENPETVQLYLTIANEEKKHYNIIENICDFVMRPKYYLKWREYSDLDDL